MDCKSLFENALKAARELNTVDGEKLNKVLLDLAAATESNIGAILEANAKDLSRMDKADPKYDRLKLTETRIKGITGDIRNVVSLPSPLGKTIYSYDKPNGLKITKVTVPFGVIGIIYEARPNVTFDVFSLCLKSGNACILKGGSDAIDSNRVSVKIIKEVLVTNGINEDVITLLPSGRNETAQLLNARGYVDLIIPRGSQKLIDFVRENASIPVIETGAGICHTYFDKDGDTAIGKAVVNNGKTRRVSVCNALDCLIIHRDRLVDLPEIVSLCANSNVIIYADDEAYKALSGKYPANLLDKAGPDSYGTEFLDYKMSVKTVGSIDGAIDHVTRYSSKHSESIVSKNDKTLAKYCKLIDAAVVYTNTSTAFTDGAEFGLGAEIGISTQKLHARGPMALEALTTYKWVVVGNGQTRA
ncbi:MAG TPA: glutamate-5-semialdehyde dehydrogenase [Bacteroidetes bacterium]|nr:glutamate-5-semialdehyde dehydrogenase [Bacteroidota bacterium]